MRAVFDETPTANGDEMRKFLILAAATLLVIPSFAQAARSRPFRSSRGTVFVTPQVSLGDGPVGLGATIGASYQLTPKLDLTGRIGYNRHFEGEVWDEWMYQEATYSWIPILAGLQYGFTPAIFGMFELGLVGAMWTGDVTDDPYQLGMTLGLGYDFGPVIGIAKLCSPSQTAQRDINRDGDWWDGGWGILIGAQFPLTTF